jgi:hypothetical protein
LALRPAKRGGGRVSETFDADSDLIDKDGGHHITMAQRGSLANPLAVHLT